MKTMQKRVAATSFAALALLSAGMVFSGCSTTKQKESSGTHQMGSPKSGSTMSNSMMTQPSRQSSTDAAGTHQMGSPKSGSTMSNSMMPQPGQ